MFGARKWLGAILDVPAECRLHREKALFNVAVIMDEILDPKLDFGPIAENHTNPVRHPLPRCSREHLRITAKLNRVIRFGRERQFCVPGLVFTRRVEFQEIGIAGEVTVAQRRLINDRRLVLNRVLRCGACYVKFVVIFGDLNEPGVRNLVTVQDRLFVFITRARKELFLFRLLIWLDLAETFQTVTVQP